MNLKKSNTVKHEGADVYTLWRINEKEFHIEHEKIAVVSGSESKAAVELFSEAVEIDAIFELQPRTLLDMFEDAAEIAEGFQAWTAGRDLPMPLPELKTRFGRMKENLRKIKQTKFEL